MAPFEFHSNYVYDGTLLPSSSRILILAKFRDILLVCLSSICTIEHVDRKGDRIPA